MKKNAFILQTNWAVYAKAAPLLYAQMTIHMESYDAVAFQRGCLFTTSSSGAQMYGGIIPYVAQALAMQKVYKSMPLVR